MKRKHRKTPLSLTLLYGAAVFLLQFAAVSIASLVLFLLVRQGFLTDLDIQKGKLARLLLVQLLFSGLVGIVLAAVTCKAALHPVTRIVDQLRELANGNFKARLSFAPPLQNQPPFAQLSDSFNTLARELDHTEILRSDFINSFSHEFKTPIVSIAGFAKLLRKDVLPPEQQREYLTIIETESLRLAAMATNILNLTKIENQIILTDVSSYNLSEQLRSCVLLLEDRWEEKNLTLDMELEEYSIDANEEMLRQVWINLLDNAIKFSSPNGEISIQVWEERDDLRVSVANHGPEIPPAKLPYIFHKFYQGDESHAASGNGIGLSIVKSVIELHLGTVQVESCEARTTFLISLPKSR